jgi:hypothetical protein
MINKYADVSLRAQVLTLSFCTSVNDQYIVAVIDYSISQIYRIRCITKDREFDSTVSLQILDKYVIHQSKSGRSIKATAKKEEEIIQLIERNRYDREKTFDQITHECDLARITI